MHILLLCFIQLSFDNPIYESTKLQEESVEFQDINISGNDVKEDIDLLPYHQRRIRLIQKIVIACAIAAALVIIVIALGSYFGSK